MNESVPRKRIRRAAARAWRILLVLALLVSALPVATMPVVAQKAQPQLLALVAQQPDTQVQVIVQKRVQDQSVEALLARLGGTVTQDLRIINAIGAQLPAWAVPLLSRLPAVRWISLDAPVVDARCSACIDTASLLSVYTQAIRAPELWNSAPYLQGQGVTVAVVDSGIVNHNDVVGSKPSANRVLTNAKFNSFTASMSDAYGHGTHVAGIIGGDGARSKGAQIGIAPKVQLVNVKVSDDRGAGMVSDVVAGLQWVLDNKATYNIRVVNLSLNSSVAESYHTSPMSAAIEILWFNGIVVVVSAGNNGINNNGVMYPPANDPFAITVGAVDDRGTVSTADDTLAPYSAYGVTLDGHAKPDIVAPGTNIVSLLASNNAELVKGHPSHRVDGFAGGKDYYFRMSGTSMAAAVVSGAVALLLQDEPNLTPDQVKFRLRATARPVAGAPAGSVGAGLLDIYAAVHATTTESANTGLVPSQLLWTGSQPIAWNSVNWNSVNWNSVNWNSVNWNSVNWNSVNWNSVNWAN